MTRLLHFGECAVGRVAAFMPRTCADETRDFTRGHMRSAQRARARSQSIAADRDPGPCVCVGREASLLICMLGRTLRPPNGEPSSARRELRAREGRDRRRRGPARGDAELLEAEAEGAL